MHYHRVALARKRQQGIELRPLGVFAGCHVDELFVHLDLIELAFRVLLKIADPDIANALTVQDVFPKHESVRGTL